MLLFILILTACQSATPPTVSPTSDSSELGSLQVVAAFLSAESPPRGAENAFTTDFGKHSVPYSKILSGGPPKDGMLSIGEPQFISVNEADEWLRDREPVVFVQVGDEARAYPIQILMWHEIVNDTVGGKPLMISFCPLCNMAIVFKRTFDGMVLT